MKEKKLIIIKDSRESNSEIYLFKAPEYLDKVLVVRNNLPCGDFSIAGEHGNIIVERKTLGDLVGSFIGEHREQFRNMWARAANISHKFLMIEGRMSDALSGEYRSRFHPHSLFGSLMSWQLKYGYSFFFVTDSTEGQACLFWLFTNYLRLKQEAEKNDRNNTGDCKTETK